MSRLEVKLKGIVEYDGKYLLMQKWYDDNIVNPYKWECVDNLLIHGLKPDGYVVENIEVSTGLGVTVDRLLSTWTYKIGDTHYLGLAFLCHAQEDIIILSDEYSNSVWVEPEKLQFYIEDTVMLQDLHTHLGIPLDDGDGDDNLELTI
ncbi:MAG: hypothetical protein IJV71_00755 [Lachnospiraceae bacterium]|nr:hypothetical protein [Lachnospiraceae bacterium]